MDKELCVQDDTYVACIDSVRRVQFDGGDKEDWAQTACAIED